MLFLFGLRFMGMKASFVSNSKPASALGKRAGFSVVPLAEFGINKPSGLPNGNTAASKLLSLLGFEGSSEGVPANELAFLHLDVKSTLSAENGVEFLNNLVGSVKELSKEGTKAYDHLFLIVVLGYGDAKSSAVAHSSFKQENGMSPELAKLRPRQSYTLKAGKPVEGVRSVSSDFPRPIIFCKNHLTLTQNMLHHPAARTETYMKR